MKQKQPTNKTEAWDNSAQLYILWYDQEHEIYEKKEIGDV